MARAMCHRHFGIGSDGLIILLNSKVATFEMRMFNPDGSEAQVCGNGLRCFAKYVVDQGLYHGRKFTIATLAGIKPVQVFVSQNKVSRVKVNMGTPRFKAEEIPVNLDLPGKRKISAKGVILDFPLKLESGELPLSFVSMGNPHAVSFLDCSVEDFPLERIGPEIENHLMFPQRINFEIARVVNKKKIEARVWERGANETLACGSGACAIAVAARLKGYTEEEVDIILPGGNLRLSWDGVGDVYLTGPVEQVFTGVWAK